MGYLYTLTRNLSQFLLVGLCICDKMMIGNEYGVLNLKSFFHALIFALCFLSLLGCFSAKDDALYALPADVSGIEDFKCVCSTDGETEFVINNDYAKKLYSYITSLWQNALAVP
ncbi:MAG: hypothetical protein ACI4OB_06195 [Christensenellales bacterium]